MRLKFYCIIKSFMIVVWLSIAFVAGAQSRELPKYLLSTPGVVEIDTLETTSFFNEKYLVIFRQPLDFKDKEAGYFNQRIFISHYSFNSPVVFVTEGYSAEYAAYANYVNELSAIFNANQIVVEHRYFDQSVPENIDWQYLTTENAARDHHYIYEAFKNIYRGKWIGTGISKGGQTALLYNMYYPKDMDVTVAYVAPVAMAVEDGRHESFLANIATPKDRKLIINFQKELLKRKDIMVPMLEKFSKKNNYTYRIPIAEVFEYCVLEFSFAFWQWGCNTESIPKTNANDATLFRYLINVCSPDYFAIEGIESLYPFFYQAARELGYYGYDPTPFEKLISLESTKGYFFRIFMPEGVNIEFDPEIARDLTKFLQERAKRVILIYGEYDPWTAAAADPGPNPNVLKVIAPGGSHMSRIKTLPKVQHDHLIKTIASWIK